MESGGVTRTYRLYVPASYSASKPAAVVLNFHGFGSSAAEQEAYSRMTAMADRAGFITVAPDGTGSPRRWYIYGMFEPGFVDDFAFVDDLLDHLSTTLCIDERRVYATGISNGGGMSSLLGCRLNDRIAAIAPVAGSPFPGAICRGKQPVPAIIFHGTEDSLVPFEGGVGGRLGLALQSVRQNAADWAAHNGCAPAPSVERVAPDVLRESFSGCKRRADVVLYVVEGGGHTWPGAVSVPLLGRTTQSIDATSLIWEFFASHPRAER
jgi:polyhydroxybutyrate depolymerase